MLQNPQKQPSATYVLQNAHAGALSAERLYTPIYTPYNPYTRPYLDPIGLPKKIKKLKNEKFNWNGTNQNNKKKCKKT